MAPTRLTCESTLTDRYQTTIPDIVRKTLQLHKRDKINYAIQLDGQVFLSRRETNQDDPVLDQFLTFLAQDIGHHPQHITSIGTDLHNRIKSLVDAVPIDLDCPLAEEDE